ncbi:MAG TPA: hypothetical protein VGZ29_02050 [Terriglobia bacterium]|nr:hypothetical protein [Terriglobia bacterium]
MDSRTAGICVCLLPLLASSGISRADFKYTESSKMTGGALAGMMKVAGAFSKQAREPMESTEYVKGHKMRRDSSDGHSTIIDLDGRQIIEVDNKKRTYTVLTFDQMRQQLEAARAAMQEQMAKENKDNPQAASFKMTPKLSVADGPGTRTVAGVATHEVKLDIELLMEASDPNQPSQSGQVQTWVKSDQYVASSVPGSEEVREFQQAMAKELDWVPGEMFGNNPQVSAGMAELRKNSAAQGFPMLQYVSLGMGVPGQATGANSTANSNQPPPPQSSSAIDVTNPRAAAAQSLGKMLGGFHRKKKNNDQTDNTAGATPPPADPGALMQMTVEVTSLSTDPLDASLFVAPAGYQQIPSNMLTPANHR